MTRACQALTTGERPQVTPPSRGSPWGDVFPSTVACWEAQMAVLREDGKVLDAQFRLSRVH